MKLRGKIKEICGRFSLWLIAGWLLGAMALLVLFGFLFCPCRQRLFMLLVKWVEWRHPGIDAPDNWALAIENVRRIIGRMLAASIACQAVGLLLTWRRHRARSQSAIQNPKSKIQNHL